MKVRVLSVSALFLAISFLSACASTFSGPPAAEPEVSSDVSTATESVSNGASEGEYRLDEGDVIGIQVFDEPDLTLQATVSSRGGINYSYLGDLRVSGKTPGELEKHITDLLRDGYLVNPSVNVSIVEFRPFFIGGEVRSPGSYPYQPGLTLDKAIALAGGLTDRASPRQMFLVTAGQRSNNSRKVSLDTRISPGDTITIKEGFF